MGKKEFTSFKYEDLCSDKNVKFLGKKLSILSSQCLDFVDKIREIVRIKEEELGHEKIMRLFFDSNWVRRNVALNGNYSL
jgi:hypothetical protein